MDKNYKLFLILGVVVIIVPFLGFPEVVGSVILFIVGVVLIVISLMFRKHLLPHDSDEGFLGEVFNEGGNDHDKDLEGDDLDFKDNNEDKN